MLSGIPSVSVKYPVTGIVTKPLISIAESVPVPPPLPPLPPEMVNPLTIARLPPLCTFRDFIVCGTNRSE